MRGCGVVKSKLLQYADSSQVINVACGLLLIVSVSVTIHLFSRNQYNTHILSSHTNNAVLQQLQRKKRHNHTNFAIQNFL